MINARFRILGDQSHIQRSDDAEENSRDHRMDAMIISQQQEKEGKEQKIEFLVHNTKRLRNDTSPM